MDAQEYIDGVKDADGNLIANTSYAADTSFIAPERLYTMSGYIRCSGIAKSRIREARLMGIELPTLKVGKRLYVRGIDGIQFVETLAAL